MLTAHNLSVRTRLLLLIAGLLVIAIVSVAATLGGQARNAILIQAEADGNLIARVLAQAASVTNTVPGEVETVMGDQMIAEALIAAHMIDVAEKEGLTKQAIDDKLMEIAARAKLDEIWGFDGEGHSRYSSLPDVDLEITQGIGAAGELGQFRGLITGERFSVIAPSFKRSLDGKIFKYAGVRRVDRPGAVLVGIEFSLIQDVVDRIGMRSMVRSLLDSGRLNAILIFDHNAHLIASGGVGTLTTDMSRQQQSAVEDSVRVGHTRSWLDGSSMVVVTPIPGPDGAPIGATQLWLPTEGLDNLQHSILINGSIIAIIILTLSIAVGSWYAHRLVQPLLSIGEAAQAVEQQSYARGQLADVERRRDEFGHLARVFENMAKTVFARQEELDALVKERTLQLSEKNDALEKANAQINQDLDLAKRMQTAILPAEFPDDRRFSGYALMKAARHIGGDFYDYFMIDERRLAVVIADVSGKGVPAAFFMAIARTVMQGTAKETTAPGECMAKANDLICKENPLELFVTLFYGILDIETGMFRYANAGHNCPYVVRGSGEISVLPGTNGTACGIMEGLPYDEAEITLAAGDSLFLFTDGVTEAFNLANEEYGEERLAGALQQGESAAIADLAGQVVASVATFVGAAPQSDDLTCLALRYHGQRARSEAA